MKGDKCSYCDKPAIGYEFYRGIKGVNVCEVHASDELKALKPGHDIKQEFESFHKYEAE